MKQKIVIIPAWYPNDAGNFEGIFIQNQAISLSKTFDVKVLVPYQLPNFFGYLDLPRHLINPSIKFDESRGFQVARMQIPRLTTQRWFENINWHYYYKVVEKAFSNLIKFWGKPDVLHSHVVLPAGWLAMKLGRRYHIQVVLTEHTGPFSFHLQTPLQRQKVHETLLSVNRVVAVSPALANDIHQFEPDIRIDTVGNLIRTDFFQPVTDQKLAWITHNPFRFLTIASYLTEAKGTHHLIEAVHILYKLEVQDFTLFIGGNGPDYARLKQMVESLGIASKVVFLGMLSQEQVLDWIQKTDLFISPSLGETFGMLIAEAMSCGKPVIATRCGGPEFIVEPGTGILVNKADPVDLAEAMESVLSGKVHFEPGMIRQSIVSRFGEEAFIRNITEIYQSL